MPSNRLAIVTSSPQQILNRCKTYIHGGIAMLLPIALYLAESVLSGVLFPVAVHPFADVCPAVGIALQAFTFKRRKPPYRTINVDADGCLSRRTAR